MKNMEHFLKEWEASPELRCNHCGVIFKGNHECDYEKLKEKVKSLQSQLDAKIMFVNNGMEEEQYALQEKVIRYEKALKAIVEYDDRDIGRYATDSSYEFYQLKKIATKALG